MSGGTWDGYTSRADDGKPVSEEFRALFPPGTFDSAATKRAPGHAEQPPRSLVHDAPSTPGAERPAARVAKPKKPKARPKKQLKSPQQFRTNKKAR